MADPEAFDLDAAIADMRPSFIQCRDFGHGWRPFTVRYLGDVHAYEQQLRCTRCRTVRRRLLSQRGAVLRNGYDYADGYIVPGMGRLVSDGRDAVRLASIQQLLLKGAADNA